MTAVRAMAAADWDRYLRTYHGERPGITEQAFEHARDAALGTPYDWLVQPLPSPGDVLDVACGNAPLQPRLAGATTYLGVDLSEAELGAARGRGRGPVVRADARALPLADASTDTVVSSMGLMLVHPLGTAVAEIARVLRPGGVAAFLLPSPLPLRPSDLRPLATLSGHLRGPGSMPQQVTRRRLSGLLRGNGLRVVGARRHRFVFPLHTSEHVRLALRSLYTPGRTPEQLARAEQALGRLAGPSRHLPLPLLRLVAHKGR